MITPAPIGTEIAKSLLSKGTVADSLADLYGIVLGDRIANWRLRNVIATHAKIADIARAENLVLVPDRIPERFAFTWFEEASKQESDSLRELFARLLARAASESSGLPDERLIRMLSLLTPNDAKLFQLFYRPHRINTTTEEPLTRWNRDPVARLQFLRLAKDDMGGEASKSLEALLNAGCIYETDLVKRRLDEALRREEISLDQLGQTIAEAVQHVPHLTHTELGLALAVMTL